MKKEQIQIGGFYVSKSFSSGRSFQYEVLEILEDGIGVKVKVWLQGSPKTDKHGKIEEKRLLICHLLQIPFSHYEVNGCAEFTDPQGIKFTEQVEEDDAQFFSLYGNIPFQGLECIGDFKTREAAEIVLRRITGT